MWLGCLYNSIVSLYRHYMKNSGEPQAPASLPQVKNSLVRIL